MCMLNPIGGAVLTQRSPLDKGTLLRVNLNHYMGLFRPVPVIERAEVQVDPGRYTKGGKID